MLNNHIKCNEAMGVLCLVLKSKGVLIIIFSKNSLVVLFLFNFNSKNVGFNNEKTHIFAAKIFVWIYFLLLEV
ncbi:MAG: hypothetical protein COB60_12125 [Flavobacteriaceae bacterium]|nr:MAG: hypothetical protein COB60_12125 [Flavobacteriaceae bacterium]